MTLTDLTLIIQTGHLPYESIRLLFGHRHQGSSVDRLTHNGADVYDGGIKSTPVGGGQFTHEPNASLHVRGEPYYLIRHLFDRFKMSCILQQLLYSGLSHSRASLLQPDELKTGKHKKQCTLTDLKLLLWDRRQIFPCDHIITPLNPFTPSAQAPNGTSAKYYKCTCIYTYLTLN